MPRLFSCALALLPCAAAALLAVPSGVHASEDRVGDDWDGAFGKKGRHRADLHLGGSLGLGAGAAHAYPNELEKIDDPTHEAATGFAGHRLTALWVGGALADWLNVGVGFGGIGTFGGEGRATGFAFLFRIETFPLLTAFEGGERLGLFGAFGAGSFDVREGARKGEGGATSVVSLGAFHETLDFGGFRLGPVLESLSSFSVTGELHAALVGARLAFYAGP